MYNQGFMQFFVGYTTCRLKTSCADPLYSYAEET